MTGPKNLAASIRERLRNRATAEQRPFDEVLAYYAIERFLFRLSRTRHRDHFVLKGALMLPLWGATLVRPTRDIDLLGRGNPTAGELAAMIADCITIDVLPDALSFDTSSIETSEIREQERYGGLRVTFRATLERARIKMQVDIGLGDVVTPDPVAITYPALLDLPAPELIGYPVETAIAEKLEALVDLGMANSRMKDFFDLWSLLSNLDLDGRTISMAVKATFTRRGTAIPRETPAGLTAEFASDASKQKQWEAFVRRLRLSGQPEFSEIVTRLGSFAMPIFDGACAEATLSARWSPGKGWIG